MSAAQFARGQTIFLLALIGAVTIAVTMMWLGDGVPDPTAGARAPVVEVTGSSVQAAEPAAAPAIAPQASGTQGADSVAGVSELGG